MTQASVKISEDILLIDAASGAREAHFDWTTFQGLPREIYDKFFWHSEDQLLVVFVFYLGNHYLADQRG